MTTVEVIVGQLRSVGNMTANPVPTEAADLIISQQAELSKAKAALKDLIYVLKEYNGAFFPGELTRQKLDVPINGFSALCEMGFKSMENAHGKDWMQRRFDEVSWDEKWDRIAQSSAHNFLKRLDTSLQLANEVVTGG